MRRVAWAALLCLGGGLCSVLYAVRQLALSLEQEAPRRQGGGGGGSAFPVGRQLSGGGGGGGGWRAVAGSAGRGERQQRLEMPERYNFVKTEPSEKMHLAVVACGERLEETVTMLRSAIIFSIKPLQFHIFAEDLLHSDFRKILDSLSYQDKFNYTLYPISFPTENAAEWKKLFKPCASQRLFLPLILRDVDSLLYVDTDILFLRPIDDIWSFLKKFNSSQIAAMAPEHEEPRIGWYNRFARHPYYGKTGVNSGVMLINMTRIRRKYFKKVFLFFLVNGITDLTIVFMEAIASRLKKMEYSFFMETEVFTMMINNLPFELCMRQ